MASSTPYLILAHVGSSSRFESAVGLLNLSDLVLARFIFATYLSGLPLEDEYSAAHRQSSLAPESPDCLHILAGHR